MIKSELIDEMARKFNNIPEKKVEDSVNFVLERLVATLCQGGRIEVRGFGSFSLHYRPPRNAHNPKTGERLITEAKYAPHFKPGKEMRDRVNAAAKQERIDRGEESEDGAAD